MREIATKSDGDRETQTGKQRETETQIGKLGELKGVLTNIIVNLKSWTAL